VTDSILTANWPAFRSSLYHLVLPAIVLSTIPMAIIARMARSSMLEVLGQDYLRTARAKGVAERSVITKHALKNALIPVVTVIGLQFGGLLSGAFLTETVFARPGVGRYVVTAIGARDYPVIQAAVLIVAVLFVLINLLVDLIYAFLDPRIQYG
jgi:peptide/nickel transport system permease protein